MVKLNRVTKKYGKKTVIEDLSFTFEDGKTYILHGKSGSGKSTLLSMIAGTDRKFEGEIVTRTVSMSFQDANLLPALNVLDNVMLAVNAGNCPPGVERRAYLAGERERAVHLLNDLGISELSQYPGELSGGMQARVGIARALMKPADVYLFDEPFAGLDKETIAGTAAVIRRSVRGKTVIAVVHDSIGVPEFGDVILELIRGTPSALHVT